MTYLLDTDTCSYHLRRSYALSSRFLQYGGRIAIPTLVFAELYVWAFRLSDPQRRIAMIEEIANETTVLSFELESAAVFGRLRAAQLRQGKLAPTTDLMIAAVAITHDLTLVTHNTKDYQHIPDLNLTDWIDE